MTQNTEPVIFGKVCKRCKELKFLKDFPKGKQVCKKCSEEDKENRWWKEDDPYNTSRITGWNGEDEIYC